MEFKDLTPEQQEKAKACKTAEDILALVREEGLELTDDELAAVSGGELAENWRDCEARQCNHLDPVYGCRYIL